MVWLVCYVFLPTIAPEKMHLVGTGAPTAHQTKEKRIAKLVFHAPFARLKIDSISHFFRFSSSDSRRTGKNSDKGCSGGRRNGCRNIRFDSCCDIGCWCSWFERYCGVCHYRYSKTARIPEALLPQHRQQQSPDPRIALDFHRHRKLSGSSWMKLRSRPSTLV